MIKHSVNGAQSGNRSATRRGRAIRGVFDNRESKVNQEAICPIKSTGWQKVAFSSARVARPEFRGPRWERIGCDREH